MKPDANLQGLLLHSAGEGIGALDLQGRITFINPTAARMPGWEVEELMGKPLHMLVHHTQPDVTSYPEDACPLCASVLEGSAYHCEEEIIWRRMALRCRWSIPARPSEMKRARSSEPS